MRDLTKKERGRGRKADSVLAKNSGTYDTIAPSEENDTILESACNLLTRLAVANDKRKRTFWTKSAGIRIAKVQTYKTASTPEHCLNPKKEAGSNEREPPPETTVTNPVKQEK